MTIENIMDLIGDRLDPINPSSLLMSDKSIADAVVEILLSADRQSQDRKKEFEYKGSLDIKIIHDNMPTILPTLGRCIALINDRQEGVTMHLEKREKDFRVMNLIYKTK